MKQKFVIKKKSISKEENTVCNIYYLQAFFDDDYNRIIDVFDDIESAKVFLNKIKNIYPDPKREYINIYNDGRDNKIQILSESHLENNTLEVVRTHTIFNNYECIKIVKNDLYLAISQAEEYVEKIKQNNISFIEEPEVVLELTVYK